MTDRVIIYPGAVPLETDLLSAQVGAMVAIGYGLGSVLGESSVVTGLTCFTTSPASLSVLVGRGAITQLSVVDGFAFSSIPASSDPLIKIGINRTPTPLSFVAPTTPGQSQTFLIQSQFSETDTAAIVLPYFDAANPTISFAGPDNSNTVQNTQRIQRALIQVKNGVPAPTGSQTAPTVDAGWVPLYLITLANGAVSVASGNIAVHPAAPFLPATLPQIGSAMQALATTAGLTFAPTDPTQEAQAVSIIGRRTAVLTSSGSWICPAGVTRIRVRIVGGGGGGGGGNSTYAGAGGGAGGYAEGDFAVAAGTAIAVTVGAGGAGGGNGQTGATTSFGALMSAAGGNGGAGAGSANSAGGAGGVSAGGAISIRGGDGNDGNATSGTSPAGGGGASAFGGGGRGGSGGGATASVPGSGGGGAYGSAGGSYGGNGAAGIVIVEY